MKPFIIAIRAIATFSIVIYSTTSLSQDVTGYLDYDPATGSLSFDNLLVDRPVTTLQLISTLGVYTGERPEIYSVFDNYSLHHFFTLTPEGLPSPDFGPLMSPGIDPEVLANDLCLSGSRLPNGALEGIQLRVEDESWPISTPGVHNCPDVPDVLCRTIEPIDFYLDYNATSGNLSLDSTNQSLGAIVLRTDRTEVKGRFIGEAPDLVSADSESILRESVTFGEDVLSYINITGFETADFGRVIEPGLQPDQLAAQLCFKARTVEGEKAESLFVRAGGETHQIACGLLKENRRTVSAEGLNELINESVDVGVVMNSEEGTLVIHVPETPDGASQPLTRIEIESAKELFIPGAEADGTLDGIFDSLTSHKLIKSDSNGFTTVDFGEILLPGFTTQEVEDSIHVSGFFAIGATVNSVQVVELNAIPEPSAQHLVFLALSALGLFRRCRTKV